MERANRTLRESLEDEPMGNLLEARRVIARHVQRYNHERLHSALGYLPPWEVYRGNPAERHEGRNRPVKHTFQPCGSILMMNVPQ
jgi:transposase InsO family protein